MRRCKRSLDIIISLLGLSFLLPLFFLIGLLIKIHDGGGTFFIQRRIGHHGRPFLMWKFRTMVVDAEKKGDLLSVGDDPRITRVGYFLRKYKIDELPQLFNVLKGEMSLVGPRPEVEKYVNLYDEKQKKVLELIPGITDPASISFVNENEMLSGADNPERMYIDKIMPEKIRLNLEYANEASCWKDFLIIIKTIAKIFV